MTSGKPLGRVKRPDHAITTTGRVPFQFCDPLGVVWHGRYFELFEVARTELFRSIELAVPQIRDKGYKMFVVEANCRYMAPLVYDQHYAVTAWFTAATPLIRVAYDVYNLDLDRWSARAFTRLATTRADGTLLAETPEGLRKRLPVA